MSNKDEVIKLLKKILPIVIIIIFVFSEIFVEVFMIGGVIGLIVNEKCIRGEPLNFYKLVNSLSASLFLHIIPIITVILEFFLNRKIFVILLTISSLSFIIFAMELFFSK
ncbi:MAG: hypothetical protein LKJ13_03435 [Clostridia bacterium]|jgi:hypothetical protein|nr:hypothetical protein [Clostridia bacterium]MCI2000680.1 hypothetical protein [Clostridia bacterium]MCI2015247.1 hypothetical protein [Clostridia bacterium]